MREAGKEPSRGETGAAAGAFARRRAGALAPRLELLGAAALFSTGGALIKAVHLGGWQVASLRSGMAAAALLALVPASRRRPSPRVLAVAAAYAATLILFVLANKLTTAASTIFLQSTAPLYVLLLSPWLLGERIHRRDFAYMAVLALGLTLLFVGLDPASATAPEPLRGDLLAALAGLGWALTLIGMRFLSRQPTAAAAPGVPGAGPVPALAGASAPSLPGSRPPAFPEALLPALPGAPPPPLPAAPGPATAAAAAFWGNMLASLAALPWALPLPAGHQTDWLVIAFMGVFQIALAYALLTRGIGKLRALEASLLLLLEPVLNPIWAWLVHGEHPGAPALAGGALILAATLARSWLEARPARAH